MADPYIDPASGILRNRLGVTDPALLRQLEADLSFLRLVELSRLTRSGPFDLARLQFIHRALFQDVYDWAGELRTVDVGKDQTLFARPAFLATEFTRLYRQRIERGFPHGLSRQRFAEQAAQVLAGINALHPFREGNGRTQREFLRQLAASRGFTLNWSRVCREDMLAASIEATFRDELAFAPLLIRALAGRPR